jgi:hypothetical protein
VAFEDLHRHVARIALKAAGRKYEVALAGGNALMVHHVVSRHTEDVDLFVRQLGNVAPAAAEIQAALEAAGYATERLDAAGAGGLGDLWADAGEELAEWEVTAPDGEHTVQVQVAYFETLADPVTVPDLGPVLALEDLAGWKTVALSNRMAARDYVDIAQLLKHYTVPELIALALERDPGLQQADFADAALHLDQMRDTRLTTLLTGLNGEDASWLRQQFATWPRDAAPREELLQPAPELRRQRQHRLLRQLRRQHPGPRRPRRLLQLLTRPGRFRGSAERPDARR